MPSKIPFFVSLDNSQEISLVIPSSKGKYLYIKLFWKTVFMSPTSFPHKIRTHVRRYIYNPFWVNTILVRSTEPYIPIYKNICLYYMRNNTVFWWFMQPQVDLNIQRNWTHFPEIFPDSVLFSCYHRDFVRRRKSILYYVLYIYLLIRNADTFVIFKFKVFNK